VATIGVGMLGYAFMGKAHSNAFRKIPYITWPPPLEPELIGIAGRNEEAVAEAARRYGWEYATTDWRDLSRTNGSGCSTTAAELTPRRADDRGGAGRQARRLREAARPGRGRELRDLESGGRDRRPAHVRLQLPVRPGRTACAGDGGGGRARRVRTSAAAICRTGATTSLDTWRFDAAARAPARSAI
jgi:Predicted dehydrogenases and related proteins